MLESTYTTNFFALVREVAWVTNDKILTPTTFPFSYNISSMGLSSM